MGLNKNLKKTLWLSFISILVLVSCQHDEFLESSSGQMKTVQFAVHTTLYANHLGDARVSNHIDSMPIPAQIIITIKKGEKTLYDHKILPICKTDKGYFSKALIMNEGTYTLEDFVIEDIKNRELYVAPHLGDKIAPYVEHPLPLSFNVTKVSKKITLQTLYLEVFPCEQNIDKIKIDLLGWVLIPDHHFMSYLRGRFAEAFFGKFMNPKDKKVKSTDGIFVKDENISTLEGVQYFNTLKYLNCSGNQLKQLNISNNEELIRLDCSNNLLLKTLKLNPQLQVLNFNDNDSFNNLDLKTNLKLKILSIQETPIDSLDLSKNNLLDELYCQNSGIIMLDIKKMKKQADDGKLIIYGEDEKYNQLKILWVHDYSKNHKAFKTVKKITKDTQITTFDDNERVVCANYDPIEEKCMDSKGEESKTTMKASVGAAVSFAAVAGAIGLGCHIAKKRSMWGHHSHHDSHEVELTPRTHKEEEPVEQEQETEQEEEATEEESPCQTSWREMIKEEVKESIIDAAVTGSCVSLGSPEEIEACQSVKESIDEGQEIDDIRERGPKQCTSKTPPKGKEPETGSSSSSGHKKEPEAETGSSGGHKKETEAESSSSGGHKKETEAESSSSGISKTDPDKKGKQKPKSKKKKEMIKAEIKKRRKQREIMRNKKKKAEKELKENDWYYNSPNQQNQVEHVLEDDGIRSHRIDIEEWRDLPPRRRMAVPKSTTGLRLKSQKEPIGRLLKPKFHHGRSTKEEHKKDFWFLELLPKKSPKLTRPKKKGPDPYG